MSRIAPHLVLDDFLPGALRAALLEQAIMQTDVYERTGVVRRGEPSLIPKDRMSWRRREGLGVLEDDFVAAVSKAQPAIAQRIGIAPFAVESVETELVAHRHGDFYQRHIDTFLNADRAGRARNRVLTMVYYFHSQPRAFSGGELAIHPFGGGEPALIEPRDNRLVAFPSFVPHEVLTVNAPDQPLSAARFAINAWFNRAQPA